MHGTVAGIEITLINGEIIAYERMNNNTSYNIVCIKPSEIIIGRRYSNLIKTKKISSSIMALNYMFANKPLKQRYDFLEKNPSLLEYLPVPEIVVKDNEGEITLNQRFSVYWSIDKITYNIIPVIEITFSEPIELEQAIAKLASLRNLFSFFADFYLPLENITFADEKSRRNDGHIFCDCTLLLNYKDEIEVPNRPFLISIKDFEHNFNDIWHKWSEFYKETKYIVDLFYEIICNRSTFINCFLNLTQSLEIYSKYYRKEDAYEIAKSHNCRVNDIEYVPLKYHIESILLYLNSCLDIDISKRKELANKIAKMRHFFTHYNCKKYREPSFQELSSANRVLRFVLLAIVYKTVGIADTLIKKCMKTTNYSRFYQDIEIILKQDNSLICDSIFDD